MFICIAFSLQSEELREYKITGSSFIFRGKELKMGEKFTKEEFEKKFGKCYASEFNPFGLTLFYDKEKILFSFNIKNEFYGIRFNFTDYENINLHGIIINKDDTYSSVRKKLEKAKSYFTVTEDVSPKYNNIRITTEYPADIETKKIVVIIVFEGNSIRKVDRLSYFYKPSF